MKSILSSLQNSTKFTPNADKGGKKTELYGFEDDDSHII